MAENRDSWGSTFGFLMAAIGSAVGLGNIWGFPYKMGMNGGGIFLVVYLVLAALVGVVVMLGEFSMGRQTGRGPVGAYRALCKKFTFVGYFGVFCGFLITSFYAVLGGIVLKYMVSFLAAIFKPSTAAVMTTASGDFFGGFVGNGGQMILCLLIFMAVTVFIVSAGVSGGIEKFSSVAMPALAVLLGVVIIYVAFQPGAGEGYKFMFGVHTEAIKEVGLWTIVKTAAGQMFFSLSLAMGIMITFGSYLTKETALVKNSTVIVIADTCVAIMAGMAVMPACFAYGLEPGQGPGLLFVTLHSVFAEGMGGFIGAFMGFLFYLLVFIAAVTSSISLVEGVVTFVMDRKADKGLDSSKRRIPTIIIGVLIFAFGIPVSFDALGGGISGGAMCMTPAELFGMTDNIHGWNDCWLDFYDVITEGILMPLGAFLMCIMVGWVTGSEFINREVQKTPGVTKWTARSYFDICYKIVSPVILVVVLIAQFGSFFG